MKLRPLCNSPDQGTGEGCVPAAESGTGGNDEMTAIRFKHSEKIAVGSAIEYIDLNLFLQV